MNILIAPNAFKGSLSAEQACEAMATAARNIDPAIQLNTLPVADGGDGLTAIMAQRLDCQTLQTEVHGPLGEKIKARYAINTATKIAIMDMAECAGLVLLPAEKRNPELSNTFGLGQLIRHCIEQGAQRLLIGIGGSATNDAGIGMAHALGYRFYDQQGHALEPIGKNLSNIATIDASNKDSRLEQLEIDVICDVDNPLFGPEGAAYIYGPQKGADQAMVERLDKGLRDFANLIENDFGVQLATIAGAGAAGGLGAGLMFFCKAKLKKGIDVVLDTLNFDHYAAEADLILTGEGCIDEQTLYGKAPAGVAERAKQFGKPCIAFAGKNNLPQTFWTDAGFNAVVTISKPQQSLEQAIANAKSNLIDATSEVLQAYFYQEAKN